MQPGLPLEVLDHIFLFLRRISDVASLRACSHVNRLFCSLTERHIYFHLTLNNLDSDKLAAGLASSSTEFGASQVLDLLSERQHLAAYVRSLRIRLSTQGLLTWMLTMSTGDDDLARVLPLLTNLESLALSDRGYPSKKVVWKRLSRELQAAFVKLPRQLSSLKRLTIRGIEEFPLEAIGGYSSLESLVLSDRLSYGQLSDLVQSRDSVPLPNLVSAGRSNKTQLKSLTLRYCTYSLPAIAAWATSSDVDITRLSRIKTTLERPADYERLSSIFWACKNVLEELELDPGSGANLFSEAYAQDDTSNPTPLNAATATIIRQLNPPKPLFSFSEPDLSSIPSPSSHPRSSISGSALAHLPALRHLTLKLTIEAQQSFWVDSSDSDSSEEVVYSTPFVWVGSVLEELATPSSGVACSLSSESTSTSTLASSATANVDYVPEVRLSRENGRGRPPPGLERLTLDIVFKADSYVLHKVSWAPLASALSSLSSSVSSLRCVEIRVVAARLGIMDENEILKVLEGDTRLGVLIRNGLVRVVDGSSFTSDKC